MLLAYCLGKYMPWEKKKSANQHTQREFVSESALKSSMKLGAASAFFRSNSHLTPVDSAKYSPRLRERYQQEAAPELVLTFSGCDSCFIRKTNH